MGEFLKGQKLVPDITTCKGAVDAVTGIAGVASNFTPGGPVVGAVVGIAIEAVGDVIKEKVCPPPPAYKHYDRNYRGHNAGIG